MRDIAKVEVQQAKINAIKAKGSSLIGLQHLQNDDCILDTTKASEELWSLFEATKDPDPEIECKQFPVPSGATWENFTFEQVDINDLPIDSSGQVCKDKLLG